jgi:hypothetical protein
MPGRNRKTSVIALPISPAPTSVVRAPMASATGPVNAYESGTRPIEMNQSKLETRPSIRPGTSRCLVVIHTMSPALSRALNAKQKTIACQGSRAMPYPAIMRVEAVQTRYMKVMCRRGTSRLPMTTAATIAPMPPSARMTPRSLADLRT